MADSSMSKRSAIAGMISASWKMMGRFPSKLACGATIYTFGQRLRTSQVQVRSRAPNVSWLGRLS